MNEIQSSTSVTQSTIDGASQSLATTASGTGSEALSKDEKTTSLLEATVGSGFVDSPTTKQALEQSLVTEQSPTPGSEDIERSSSQSQDFTTMVTPTSSAVRGYTNGQDQQPSSKNLSQEISNTIMSIHSSSSYNEEVSTPQIDVVMASTSEGPQNIKSTTTLNDVYTGSTSKDSLKITTAIDFKTPPNDVIKSSSSGGSLNDETTMSTASDITASTSQSSLNIEITTHSDIKTALNDATTASAKEGAQNDEITTHHDIKTAPNDVITASTIEGSLNFDITTASDIKAATHEVIIATKAEGSLDFDLSTSTAATSEGFSTTTNDVISGRDTTIQYVVNSTKLPDGSVLLSKFFPSPFTYAAKRCRNKMGH